MTCSIVFYSAIHSTRIMHSTRARLGLGLKEIKVVFSPALIEGKRTVAFSAQYIFMCMYNTIVLYIVLYYCLCIIYCTTVCVHIYIYVCVYTHVHYRIILSYELEHTIVCITIALYCRKKERRALCAAGGGGQERPGLGRACVFLFKYDIWCIV